MLENIETSRVLAEEDREPSECILEKNLEENLIAVGTIVDNILHKKSIIYFDITKLLLRLKLFIYKLISG